MFSFTDDAKKDARFCDGDNAFWLVGIRVSELDDDCGQSNLLNTPTDCFFHAGVFEIPKGWDTLDGSQWVRTQSRVTLDRHAISICRSS